MKMTLVAGGICRDGGSLAADFQHENGSLLSILLEVVGGDGRADGPRFGHLHAGSTIQSSCTSSTIVEKGSEREARLLAEIDGWLSGAGEIVPPEQQEAFAALLELRRQLPNREG